MAPPPYLTCSRPALRLLEAIGHGRRHFTFADAAEAHPAPASTLTRHLHELTQAGLVLKVRWDAYATPRKPTHALLACESDAYARSLLLHHDVLEQRGILHAFACLPVRRILDFELPTAIPVLRPPKGTPPPRNPYPQALWYAFGAGDATTSPHGFPADAREDPTALRVELPELEASLALALLAATADPRLVSAVRDAAKRMGVVVDDVVRQTRRLVPETAYPEAFQKNTVVYPDWLQPFLETARHLHARHATARGLTEAP